MPTFDQLKELFSRSHTLLLLDDFAAVYAVPAPKKLDLAVMAKAQEDFEHLTEVFEQDLRLGEVTPTVEWCRQKGCALVLRAALWHLLQREQEDAASLLACKAVLISDEEKVLSENW